MSTFVDLDTCPRCGRGAITESRDGDYRILDCSHCGYQYERYQWLDRDEAQRDGFYFEDETAVREVTPPGSVVVHCYDRSHRQAIQKRLDGLLHQGRYTDIVRAFKETPELDPEQCYLGTWDNGLTIHYSGANVDLPGGDLGRRRALLSSRNGRKSALLVSVPDFWTYYDVERFLEKAKQDLFRETAPVDQFKAADILRCLDVYGVRPAQKSDADDEDPRATVEQVWDQLGTPSRLVILAGVRGDSDTLRTQVPHHWIASDVLSVVARAKAALYDPATPCDHYDGQLFLNQLEKYGFQPLIDRSALVGDPLLLQAGYWNQWDEFAEAALKVRLADEAYAAGCAELFNPFVFETDGFLCPF